MIETDRLAGWMRSWICRHRVHGNGLLTTGERQDLVEPSHVDVESAGRRNLASHAVPRAADGDREQGISGRTPHDQAWSARSRAGPLFA
jgi:hypothetical protein